MMAPELTVPSGYVKALLPSTGYQSQALTSISKLKVGVDLSHKEAAMRLLVVMSR